MRVPLANSLMRTDAAGQDGLLQVAFRDTHLQSCRSEKGSTKNHRQMAQILSVYGIICALIKSARRRYPYLIAREWFMAKYPPAMNRPESTNRPELTLCRVWSDYCGFKR